MLSMVEAVIGCSALLALIGGCGMAARRRRWMRRQAAPTFVFADLAGYTALTEEHGDEAAVRVAHEFRRAMRALSRKHGAWQVKSMGDGVMIWAPDAGHAVALSRDVVDKIGARSDLLPVRIGVHTGPAVMRGSDWCGSAVNVAARLTPQAEPNDVLISATTREAMESDPARGLVWRREATLRVVERPIVVWRLT
jgi:class 3 adenylate cyclase